MRGVEGLLEERRKFVLVLFYEVLSEVFNFSSSVLHNEGELLGESREGNHSRVSVLGLYVCVEFLITFVHRTSPVN